MIKEKIRDYEKFNPVQEFKGIWISKKIDKDCINFMESFGFFLCDLLFYDKRSGNTKISNRVGNNALTTSQIRNFYGEVKRIEMQIPRKNSNEQNLEVWEKISTDFLLLKPKMAYNAARALKNRKDSKIADFKDVIFLAFDEVDSLEQYKNFSQFIEGILAFHKSYGGRD